MNKTIYMTYKKSIPDFVKERWTKLNENYVIDFSLDEDCINFIRTNFNEYLANLFMSIPEGMHKADLWRLCILYYYGGIYADVDIIPAFNIDKLLQENPDVTFFTCLSILPKSIFQALMIYNSNAKSPLLLGFILSFITSNCYSDGLGPTRDMYTCLHNTIDNIRPDIKYHLNNICIKICFGPHDAKIKGYPLFYLPPEHKYKVELCPNPNVDAFTFTICDNILMITRTDSNTGWGYNHSCYLYLEANECVYLFQEISTGNNNIDCYIKYKDALICNSRDPAYFNNNSSW